MRWSRAFIPTLKEVPQEAEIVSHQLMLRAGLVRMLISGVYSYLPLGLKVLNNIEEIIRQEMNSSAAEELLLPSLQPVELWIKTGRDKQMDETLIRFVDRKGRKICLGPTHEEVITELAGAFITSYRQLPVVLYQIQTKFRDEPRPRFGLIRSCEFIMKDAYSFDRDEDGLDKNYKIMYDAYCRIFKRLGLEVIITEADPGVMGGELSHEFMVPAKDGEDRISTCTNCGYAVSNSDQENCPKCRKRLEVRQAIEVGHIFKLGTKYSLALGLNFLDQDGREKPVIMGCYGIGVSRLISAIIEQNHDEDGIIWPLSVSPYSVEILPLNTDNKQILNLALDIYEQFKKENIDTIVDDRPEYAGRKFKDADLVGIPLCIIIGEENIKKDILEIKLRRDKKIYNVKREDLSKEIKRLIDAIS